MLFKKCVKTVNNWFFIRQQKTVVSSISDDNPGRFAVEGYTVSGIKFALACVILWVSPYINYVLGPRFTLALAALGMT